MKVKELREKVWQMLGALSEDTQTRIRDCGRDYFLNRRSRNTHGDGYMHENSWDTIGSCSCDTCVGNAVLRNATHYGDREVTDGVLGTITNTLHFEELLQKLEAFDGGLSEFFEANEFSRQE